MCNAKHIISSSVCEMGFPSGSLVQNLPAMQEPGNASLIPGLGTSPGEGNGNPLQCSCLENPMDRGAWWATVHGVAKSRTQLSDLTFKITADGGCSHEIKRPFLLGRKVMTHLDSILKSRNI